MERRFRAELRGALMLEIEKLRSDAANRDWPVIKGKLCILKAKYFKMKN